MKANKDKGTSVGFSNSGLGFIDKDGNETNKPAGDTQEATFHVIENNKIPNLMQSHVEMCSYCGYIIPNHEERCFFHNPPKQEDFETEEDFFNACKKKRIIEKFIPDEIHTIINKYSQSKHRNVGKGCNYENYILESDYMLLAKDILAIYQLKKSP